MIKIGNIRGREILDSRGNPTVEADVTLADGTVRNVYNMRLRNMQGDARDFRLSLTSDEILRIDVEAEPALVVRREAVHIVGNTLAGHSGREVPEHRVRARGRLPRNLTTLVGRAVGVSRAEQTPGDS